MNEVVNSNEVVNDTVENTVDENVSNEVTETSESNSSNDSISTTEEPVSDNNVDNIVVPEVMTHESDDPDVGKEVTDEYSINFTMSYSQYIKARNQKILSDSDAASIIFSVASHYKEADPTEVMQFFEIPSELYDKVASRKYTISTEVLSIDNNYQVILAKYTLKFGDISNSRILLPNTPVVI